MDETLRLVQAFQYTDQKGEGGSLPKEILTVNIPLTVYMALP